MFDHSIRFPLAAAMLAAMGGVAGGHPTGARASGEGDETQHRCLSVGEVPGPALTSIEAALAAHESGASADAYLSFESSGETVYVGETIIQGRTAAVEVRASGEVRSVELEISERELPGQVKRMVDAETGSYPRRAYWKKLSKGEVSYVVNARSTARAKRLELDQRGRVLKSELLD